MRRPGFPFGFFSMLSREKAVRFLIQSGPLHPLAMSGAQPATNLEYYVVRRSSQAVCNDHGVTPRHRKQVQ